MRRRLPKRVTVRGGGAKDLTVHCQVDVGMESLTIMCKEDVGVESSIVQCKDCIVLYWVVTSEESTRARTTQKY